MIKAMILSAMLGFPPTDYDEVYCMVQTLWFEARGENIEGMLPVAHVVMNRTKDKRWPNTVCGIARQKHQFSYYWDRKPDRIIPQGSEDKIALKTLIDVSLHVMSGYIVDSTDTSVYYYNHHKVNPKWAQGKKGLIIGNHTFLK